ncbi:hypothetical protein SPHINGOT1_260327 [Sphingomonas sp. T1]|nr:hypothetical protein SPHINGOT1_260327 [Sphingomonas sp. T1]
MTGEVCDALGSPFESLDLWNILIPLSGNAVGSRRSVGRLVHLSLTGPCSAPLGAQNAPVRKNCHKSEICV